MVVRLTLAALATPSMVSPGNPTRASSAMVAARTFSTTCWLRAPRCTPLVRRVELSTASTLAQMASTRCHLRISALASARDRPAAAARGGLTADRSGSPHLVEDRGERGPVEPVEGHIVGGRLQIPPSTAGVRRSPVDADAGAGDVTRGRRQKIDDRR